MATKILITGGCGYIGSHIVVELLNNDYKVVIIDDLSNSKIETLDNIQKIVNNKIDNLEFYELDITNYPKLNYIFSKENPDCVIHLAGYKSVKESIEDPIKYYNNNLISTINILNCMKNIGLNFIIFSSSATVYGDNNCSPYDETFITGNNITSPYGKTKHMIEDMLSDLCVSNKDFTAITLRYFNPCGAHESGLLGEMPYKNMSNLMPCLLNSATNNLPFYIYGSDYNTSDGTPERDFIHVVDLALGHINALQYCHNKKGYHIYNLGTGTPISVKNIVTTFMNLTDISLNIIYKDRREGDIDRLYAKVDKANNELNWRATKSLNDIIIDSWKFQVNINSDKYKI